MFVFIEWRAEVQNVQEISQIWKEIYCLIWLWSKSTIENKKTDATTIRHKNEDWAQITQKYNSNCQTGPRNQKQLHALYDILKKEI
ncbi:hypothetical protein NQ314_012594 [Rhamnusium bicolor]|uniref:Regulatory protein zeste n=1 Tax=Rhamnusium bicolor TaxID=1586634 RepID=A0AAV8XBQ7_9CUCU|nr:hypothetical protein NQ314_012594 [Rhamnusium bicolor]